MLKQNSPFGITPIIGIGRKYPIDKETFLNYCNEQIKSLKVAINRKSRGSTVEDVYFMEHLDKLKSFFLTNYVERR